MGNKKKKKKIGRPCAFLYYLLYIIKYPLFRWKYHLKINKEAIKNIKGPALILSQHVSGQDHLLAAFTFFPKRLTFVASEHFLLNPVYRIVFPLMHIITKKMFCSDVSTIVKMIRAKEEKNLIVMFPEGRLPANGVSVPVSSGTAPLVKKLGINVYFMRSKGAYHLFPKWGKTRTSGKIEIDTEKVFDATELSNLSVSEIDARLQKVFAYDEDRDYQGIRFKGKDLAKGLDGILWKCPQCKADWTLEPKGNQVRCSCGMCATLSETYELDGVSFKTISEWYSWQSKELLESHEELQDDVVLGGRNAEGNLVLNAGEAHAVLDQTTFHLDGLFFDKELHLEMPVERLAGFPITVREHFDVYDEGTLIYVYPKGNSRASIQWVAYLDELIKKNKT